MLNKSQEVIDDKKVITPEEIKAEKPAVIETAVELKKSQELVDDKKVATPEEIKAEKPAVIETAVELKKSQELVDDKKVATPEETKSEEPATEQPTMPKSVKGQEDPQEVPSATEQSFFGELNIFKDKAKEWETEAAKDPDSKAKYEAARDAAKLLYETIEAGAKEFFIDPSDPVKKAAFKKVCTDAIEAARPELEQHRVLNKAMANLGLAIVTLGIGFVIAGLINLAVTKGKHFLFFTTNSEKRLDAMEEEVDRLTAPVA